MKHRLNKKDRIAEAGKKNNKAVYVPGKAKEKWVMFRATHGKHSQGNQPKKRSSLILLPEDP